MCGINHFGPFALSGLDRFVRTGPRPLAWAITLLPFGPYQLSGERRVGQPREVSRPTALGVAPTARKEIAQANGLGDEPQR
jgi:hypothetical protein